MGPRADSLAKWSDMRGINCLTNGLTGIITTIIYPILQQFFLSWLPPQIMKVDILGICFLLKQKADLLVTFFIFIHDWRVLENCFLGSAFFCWLLMFCWIFVEMIDFFKRKHPQDQAKVPPLGDHLSRIQLCMILDKDFKRPKNICQSWWNMILNKEEHFIPKLHFESGAKNSSNEACFNRCSVRNPPRAFFREAHLLY